MGTHIDIRNGLITRRDRVDHDPANAMRSQLRQTTRRRKDGNDPFNEAVSLTMEEYEILKRIKPHLFDHSLDPLTRKKHWITFLNSTEGAMFRVR